MALAFYFMFDEFLTPSRWVRILEGGEIVIASRESPNDLDPQIRLNFTYNRTGGEGGGLGHAPLTFFWARSAQYKKEKTREK